MVMAMFVIATLILLPAISHAQGAAKFPRIVYVAFDHTPLYDSASYQSPVVQDLKMGDTVRALGIIGRFLHIETATCAGYVRASSTADLPPLPTTSGTAAASGTDHAATNSAGGERGAVQCRGITQAGRRCLRTTTDPSGYCWQHRKN
ncbi:MAG: hypothetical protein JWQ98_1439 [Chlorobi bacterium]|nr:hypothetical protein [Chlorobiota bacterium]